MPTPLEKDAWYKLTPNYKEAHLAKTSTDFYCGRAVLSYGTLKAHTVDSGRCAACKARHREQVELERWDAEARRIQAKIETAKPPSNLTEDELRKYDLMQELGRLKVLNVAAWVASYFNGEVEP